MAVTFGNPTDRSVLFLTRKWPPAVGGMETYSVRLTSELAKHVSVETIALAGKPNGLPPSPWSFVGFALRATWALFKRSDAPKVLHIGDLASWPLALLRLLRAPRPVVVLSAHGTDVSYYRRKGWKGRLYGGYLKLGAFLNRDATVIANSAATASAATATGWHGASVVPLATDLTSPTMPFGHDDNLVFVGRLVERKGCFWFVQNVLPLLPDRIRVKVAGPVWDKAEEAALEDPRVDYLGSLDKDALVAEYRSALAVIVPNIDPSSGEFEGFGLVAAEAPAVGGLVLASATGGLVEAVIDSETGFLLPPGDPQAWHDKIVEIAGWDEDRRAAFLTSAMARSRQVYSWSRVAEDVLAIYDKALGAT
jgi:phosphatidyl-myo-inositol dimannoside synthase